MELYGKIELKWKKLVIEIDFYDALRLCETGILLLLALCSDIRSSKIRNRHVLIWMGAGMTTNLVFNGYPGLLDSLLGIGTPVLLLFPFFALDLLGAGDVKLFAAVGAILGWKGAAAVILFSFMSGGAMAAALMLLRKNGPQRFRRLRAYLRTCLLTRSLVPYTELPDESGNGKFRFTYAVAAGVLIALFADKTAVL